MSLHARRTRFKQNDHIDTRNWMSKIDGDRYLTAVTIPASHNSHAVKGTPTGYTHVGKVNLGPLMPAAVEFAKRAAECQDENIETQLKMGVRCIDLRYGPKGTLRHGQIGLPGDVSGVLQVISNFLNEYPQETVLVSAKWDTWTFISNDGVAEDEQSRNMVNDSFKSNPHFYQGTSNPQLKDCRGKIIRLRQGDQAENVGVTMTTTTQQSPAFHGQSFEEWQRSHPSQSWDKWKLESDWSGIEHALEWVFTRRNQPGNPDEEKVWDSTGLNRCVIEWNIKSLELPHVILPSDFANSYNRKLLEWLYKRCSAPSVYQLGSLNLDFVGNQGHDLVRQIIRTNFA